MIASESSSPLGTNHPDIASVKSVDLAGDLPLVSGAESSCLVVFAAVLLLFDSSFLG